MPMHLNPDLVPSTVRQAVQMIVDGASERDLPAMIAGPQPLTFPAFGLIIRNLWSLWDDDSPLKRDASRNYQIAHAEDVNGLIIAWAWAIVRDEDVDHEARCAHYHRHWAKHGKTSLEAGWEDG